jgi:hypothetical protein
MIIDDVMIDKITLHELGFLQVQLQGNQRLHAWHPDLSYLAPEITSQDERRFRAYHLQVLMSRRRITTQALRKTA